MDGDGGWGLVDASAVGDLATRLTGISKAETAQLGTMEVKETRPRRGPPTSLVRMWRLTGT